MENGYYQTVLICMALANAIHITVAIITFNVNSMIYVIVCDIAIADWS
jgi:hypothetical protein